MKSKNEILQVGGIGILLLGFVLFLFRPIYITGMAIGSVERELSFVFPFLGLLVMAVGIFILHLTEK